MNMSANLSKASWRPLGLAALVVLSGCALQPRTAVPDGGGVVLPPSWQNAGSVAMASGPALSLDDAWWRAFGDPQLDALMARVLSGNIDLAVAVLRVQQAALRADQAAGDLFPTVSGRVGLTDTRPLSQGGPTVRQSSASVAAAWEADVWGRLGRLRDAASLEQLATQQDRRAVALSLAATTATLYWRLAYLDQRTVTTLQSLQYARKTLDLIQSQYQAGAVSGLEVAQAQGNVAVQEAAYAQLVQTLEDTRQALALLLGGATQTAQLPASRAFPTQPWPRIQPDLPAAVLARRPDLQASEGRLRKAFANLDASRAALYPSISLSGSVGGTGTTLGNVVRDPLGALGVTIDLPFLRWNTLQRNVGISQADAEVAVLTFRQTLFQALSEVDRTLSAQRQFERQLQALDERLRQAVRVERLFEVRYRAGAEPLKSWLDAQESRRQAELAAQEARNNQLANWVGLVQALGGGAPAVP